MSFSTGVVQTGGIADGSITTAKLADGAVTNLKVGASAAIALSKLAATPLTEFYTEIWLLPIGLGSSNQGIAMENTSSGTANTRTNAEAMTANTLAATAISLELRRFVIDFARLTGYTITWRMDAQVASGTGTFSLRNFTDTSDLVTFTTTATTLLSSESAAITVPTAEKTLDYAIENTGTSVAMRAANSRLRVKAG